MSKIYKDPCSLSNYNFYAQTHIDLDWNVDFERSVIHGSCTINFSLKNENSETNSIILDTRDLKISEITELGSSTQLEFSLGSITPCFGAPLIINLNNLKSTERSLTLKINYETSPNASALQWIESKATLGKKHPYLFSQCQAIHARSLYPCQDSPAVKFTYSASVKCPKELVTLMSACRIESTTSNTDETVATYLFEQKIKIPSYLVAIVVADLVSKKIGPISSVWTEKELIDVAAEEFSGINEMIKAAESVAGEYSWGIYDLLVLPPSFPYGGMENPCLTFVTPTLIAKDKSLVNVVHHEIAHSWTGNLVTNCNWENFWLNEGFTKFLERKIDQALKNGSEQFRQFECIDGWRILKKEVETFGETNQLTCLCPCLDGVDPDEAFSSIPYEKGHAFLYHLEELLGGPQVFDKFLKDYIQNFKGMSIDTDDFKAFLYNYFDEKKSILDNVDWNGWLYTPGMPPVTLKFDRTMADEVTDLCERLLSQEIVNIDPVYLKLENIQKIELLSQMLDKESIDVSKIQDLSDVYKMGETENAEILFKWIMIGIKFRWTPIIQTALRLVSIQGRMKFTRPTYRELYKWDEARDLAIQTFKEQKVFMHNTTASLVEKFELHLVA